ncbi:hypothetical protein GOP47_0014644 [Adiantum capillus-veneris]|nr:hypothetical protein GOP47_0014644 [Adiantum capillus-veneris]
MLDRCCRLGREVTVPVVQNLVGLISDSKLMELLGFAFSAERVKTIQYSKAFFDSGVKPISLLSQLASFITRILASGHHVSRTEEEHKFFCKQELTKDERRRLRQALSVLSEAEKQVRGLSSGAMWLIAALLQFADVQGSTIKDLTNLSASNVSLIQMEYLPSKKGELPTISKDISPFAPALPITKHDNKDERIKQQRDTTKDNLQQVWQRVLDAVNSTNLRCFLQTEGKLVALSIDEDSKDALLEFHRLEHLSRVQRSKASILQAFHAALGHRVKVRAHLLSGVNKRRGSCSSSEAAKLCPSQWAPLMPDECCISSFLTNTGDTGCRHGSPETEVACEPRILLGRGSALAQPRINSFLLEERGRVKQPSMNKPILYEDINERVFPHEAMQMKWLHQSKKRNLEKGILSLEKGSRGDGIQGCKLGLQFDTLNTMPRGDPVCAKIENCKTLATADAKRSEEENMKKESKVKECVCWRAGNHIIKAVENFRTCSEHSRFSINFLCCASIPKSSIAL